MGKININGTVRNMTSAEETEHTEARSAITEVSEARANARTATENKKASGKAKLKELGLDDAEIKALTGA